MESMFFRCNSLKSIDLSNFDMINCISYKYIFLGVYNIKYINLYYFKNDKIISNTFNWGNNPIFISKKTKLLIIQKLIIAAILI